jgi:hypothetical protein
VKYNIIGHFGGDACGSVFVKNLVEKESKGDDALKSDRLVALSCTDKYFT